ncbi:SusC/RagA family TonB-linked outer membrane protein [Flavicella sediminum]|uniref:SusC/RagA family TonB-linked outer membrane protein n=1 Tax=Flavicella sediminum TaxID=2585141 RepID=UPI0011243345|nr:TonB-dependent receptor [Flavicella sediminum]
MKFKLLANWKLKAFAITSIMLLSFAPIQAQSITVKGNVTGDGEPLPGVSILVKGTANGVISDFDGMYEIKAKKGDVLLFTYLGFIAKEIKVGDKAIINATLVSDVAALDEVVVIGYGTQKKKEVTGAVSSVKAEELEKMATSDLGTALQGQIAGVNVTQSSGAPGSESNVIIRGLSSVNASSAPLYVVDGIPQESDPKLGIQEIETIDVLKDAASAAIYGTRGAGGVILITTKKGKVGTMSVKLNSYYGVQDVTSLTPRLDFEEDLYVQFLSSATLNGTYFGETWTPIEYGITQLTNNTNLESLVVQNQAEIQNHSISVSGGKEGLTYSVVGSFFNQDGVILNSGYERFNLRANTQFTKGKLKVNTGIGLRVEKKQFAPWDMLLRVNRYHPYQQAIDPNASEAQSSGGGNTVEAQNLSNTLISFKQTDENKGEHFNANVNAEYSFTKNLKFTSRAGVSYTNDTRVRINPLFISRDSEGEVIPPQTRSGIYNYSGRRENYSWENMLNYNKKFGAHSVKVFAGYSFERFQFSSFNATKLDLVSNDVLVLNGALNDPTAGSGTNWGQDYDAAINGIIGRVQYNYRGKYLASVSVRRDGSSQFSKGKKWATFPSISLGWNVSDEYFWEPVKDVVNAFKIRVSEGTTGNQGVLHYSNQPSIVLNQDYIYGAEGADVLGQGAIQTGYKNPDLQWETTVSTNFGYDIGFFRNKLTLSSDIYNTRKKDMLMPLLLAPTTGAGTNSSVMLNIGDMTNKGIEYALKYKHTGRNKLSWNLGLTYAENDNVITNLGGTTEIVYLDSKLVTSSPGEDNVTVLKEGYEAGAFFLHETNGLIKTEEELIEYKKLVPSANLGDLRYVDQLTEDTNNDGIADAGNGSIGNEDRKYSGSGVPDFELGLNFSAYYKNFDFSMNWYGAFGGEIMNGSKAVAYKYGTHKDLAYQWTPANPTSDIPTNRGRDHENYRGFTDFWQEDGDFVRLRNLSIGYKLPRNLIEKMNISKLRFYIAAQNLLTLTKYEGYDPEVGNNGLSTRGIDRGNYPISRQFRAGVQFEF